MMKRALRQLLIFIAVVLVTSQGTAGLSANGAYDAKSDLALTDALQSPADVGAWVMTGPLSAAREGHTATLLPDGRVLAIAAGGNETASPAEASIEAYDAVAGTWQALTSMRPPRRNHTATLLPDGRVLIAGGDGGPGQPLVAASLLFDPATGALTATGALKTPRVQHTATLLPDGRVLVLGGGNPGFLASAEIFDPATGAWATVGPLKKAREYHTATLLQDGTVLAVGGTGPDGRLTSIERYSVASGTSIEVAQMASPRGFHTATLLPDGRVLIAGGDGGGGEGFPAEAELFDSATNGVSETAAMKRPRRHHTATLLPDGRVLVVGGDRNSPLAETELFDPNGPIIEWVNGPMLNQGRRFHSATLLYDGSVLAAGGYGAGGRLASAERLAPKPCDITEDVTVSKAMPDADFAQLLVLGGYQPANRKDLGVAAIDRYVAHSFVGLTKPGMRIADATLTLVAQPSGGGSGNDVFHALVARPTWANSPRISQAFGGPNGNVPGPGKNWNVPALAEAIDTPIVGNVLDAMNTDGRLDVLVQDDTKVVRMFLRLHYVCCDVWRTVSASSSKIGENLNNYMSDHGYLPAGRKVFGSQAIDRAVGHTFTLPKMLNATITEARLTVNAEPIGGGEVVFPDPHNDAIHALVAPADIGSPLQIQSWMIEPALATSWGSGVHAMSLQMNITNEALLKEMTAEERLDIFIQDDSAVYSMKLELFYACCGGWRTLQRDENASPSSELKLKLKGAFSGGLKGFGALKEDSAFAHSFTSLDRPGMHISALQLIVRGPGVGGSNDTASVLVAPVGGSQHDWPLEGNWDDNKSQTVPLTLYHTGNTNALFSALTGGRLDIYVQDDTIVDALVLKLRYDCGPFTDRFEPGPDIAPWNFIGTPRPDLWMEDTPYGPPNITPDSGAEPDSLMIGQPMWQSRAIWVRKDAFDKGNPTAACANTEAQNPIFANDYENTVCIKVANRGQAVGSGTMHLYWAKAALGLGWASTTAPDPLTGMTNGDWTEIAVNVPIPPLAAGAETVVALPWAPPEPPFQQELHTCLLARIEAVAPDHIWTETAEVNHNTMMNNNIAWRNVQVVHDILTGGGRVHPVVLRNLKDERRELAVQLRPVTEGGKQNFFDQGQAVWRMPPTLYDAWKAAGSRGRGFRHIPGDTAVIVDAPEGALLLGLPLGPREAATMQLSFAKRHIPFQGGAVTVADEIFDIEMIQMVAENGLLYEDGGVAYAVRPQAEAPSPTPTFTPTPTPTPYPAILANISTRGFVGTGDNVLIPGFIVKRAPIRVVLRARGPFMASTVPGALLDPQLQLIDNKTGTMLGMNDNWESGNCKTDVAAGFWPSDPREACLVATLAAGEYTFILSGVKNSTGVALGEVFRVDGAGVLSNISTRGLVLPDPRELIGGLIIQKSSMAVVIRGRSKSLPVEGVLCDPELTLFDVTGKVLAKNDDWGQWPNPPPGFSPPDPKESLIAMTLPPGAYTAVLGSAQACTGIGLVEVFNTAP
ncbi:MAG: kelch repeat-containing protein [Anaerolineae bacterium]